MPNCWLRRLHKSFLGEEDRKATKESYGEALKNSPRYKETVFIHQEIGGVCEQKQTFLEYLAFLKQISWPPMSVVVLLVDGLTDGLGDCFVCRQEEHYQPISRLKLNDFYAECEKEGWPYDTQHHFINEDEPISFKAAVEQLRMAV